MSLPQEYLEELNNLNKKIALDQPKDVIQYCATYFNNRVNARKEESSPSASFSFKSPFASEDPHATCSENPHSSSHEENKNSKSDLGNQEPSAFLFKNSFSVDNKIPLVSDSSLHEDADEPTPLPSSNSKFSSSKLPTTFNAFRRPSVSAETLNPNNFQNDDWKPPYHEVTKEQLARLNESIKKNFLFNNLEDDALNTVIHALQEKSFPEGASIIKQGDEGDFFYLIERGKVEYYVSGEKVSEAGPGSSFGELALMYNSPRAATVKAKTDLILWALDRLTFRRILLEVTAKKRLMYEEFLKEVKILSDLSSYQRSKLADALREEIYRPGEIIIQEGDVGENFYLIENGEADIYKEETGHIRTISKGDYFGEIALLDDLPRQASVKAKTLMKVATLGKSGFQRLLGPVVEVLKAKDPRKQENS